MALYTDWTESEFELLRRLLAPGDIAIDVGANIGCLTVTLARAVGPSGTVFAIEAQAGIFRLLAANTLLSGVLN
jgi:precorrin-6B methylase 2